MRKTDTMTEEPKTKTSKLKKAFTGVF